MRRGASIPTTVAAGTVGPLRVCATRTSAQVVNTAPVASCPLAPTGVVSDLYVNTYYVAQDSAAQRNFPALRVLSLTGPTVVAPDFVDSEVISGVEDLQVHFGIDPTGTTCAAAQYVDAFPAAGWPANSTAQIVSVRIWVLVRADSLEPGFTDNTIYQYGNRSTATGIVNNLNNGGAAGSAYQPNDGYRRLLVARTLTLRDARGC